MFFATATHPSNRQAYAHAAANAGQSLERFMSQALHSQREKPAHFTQDESSFTLSFDVPGVAKDQLAVALEGAVVRITSKDGAARAYRAAYELPQEIDPALSSAKLEHGVLTLSLAKLVAVDKATELPIQ